MGLGRSSEPFLAEVTEIITGLWGWVNDPATQHQDRVVIVAEENTEIVGVVAHHLLIDEDGRAINGHRYMMVTAIDSKYQRHGYATAIMEAVLADLRAKYVDTVEWLVHPRNLASYEFSKRMVSSSGRCTVPA